MEDLQLRVLLVCTANVCRSPMAQFLFQHALAGLDPVAHLGWQVQSAGTRARWGAPLHPKAAAVLAEKSVTCPDFLSRPLTAETVAHSDLILTATREHRAKVAELVPQAVRRTFTLRQFARLVVFISAPKPGADVSAHIAAQIPMARAQAGVSTRDEDDIADPVGGRMTAFRRCEAVIEHAVDVIVNGLTPRA